MISWEIAGRSILRTQQGSCPGHHATCYGCETGMESATRQMKSSEPRINPAARHQSPWTLRQKAWRLLWSVVEVTVFRCSFTNMYAWRVWLLRLFGAQIGRQCTIRRTVHVEVPWHLSMGHNSCLGDHCIVYSLGQITLGDRVTVSQYAHLCAGTHDHTRPDLPLLRLPIVIGDDAWIATDVYVGPNVQVGPGALIGARSSIFKDLPAWKICVGSPAKPIADRQYRSDNT